MCLQYVIANRHGLPSNGKFFNFKEWFVMSVQVSYKKQLGLLILLTLIFLIVVEVLVNVWLYFFYTCNFEDSEIFENVDYETKRNLCLDNIYLSQTYDRLESVNGTRMDDFDPELVFINSEGFRSPEFTKNKPDDTFRIFTMGGSTTYGTGVLDNQTYPAYLQSYYDESNLGINIEVINAGWPEFWSFDETNLIKERLLAFDPDLFIVYDGWNDHMKQRRADDPNEPSILWKERWLEICELGNQTGFDTLITVQPLVSTGKKILTTSEYKSKMRSENREFPQHYPLYAEQLEELAKDCSQTADLRGIFDDIQEPLFFDIGHVGPKGNQIIAENFFQLSLPILKEKMEYMSSNNYSKGLNFEEIDAKITSNDDVFFDEVNNFLKRLIFSYKTPKIASIIFQD